MVDKIIYVIGSGPGIGSTTAAEFASQGFNVALLSRDAERLKRDAKRVKSLAGKSSGQVKPFPVDVGDHHALWSTLKEVGDTFGWPEVVLFNAARVAPSAFGQIQAERLIEDFQVMNVGLYVTANWALPVLAAIKKERPDSHPCFLITGGGIWQYPNRDVFALSLQKAAQVNFAGSFSQIAGPVGIHVATVCVNGVVDDGNEVINAKNVAAKFWELYEQDENSWDSMVDIGERAGSE